MALTIVLLAGIAAPAAGHAYLESSSPASGEQLEAAPEELVLEYSGDGVAIADVSVSGPDGEAVDGDVRIDGEDRFTVRVDLADAGEGVYTVRWEILADDGHTTSGSFFFAVGEEEPDREQVRESHLADEDGVPLLASFLRGLLLVAVVGLIGLPVTVYGAVLPAVGGTKAAPIVDARSERGLIALAAGACLAAFGLGLLQLLEFRGGVAPADVVEFVGVPLGRVWIAGALIAGVGLAVLLAARRRGAAGRSTLGVGLATGLGVAATIAWSSHSATLVDRLQGTLFDLLHVVGAGLWVGGLATLALIALPALRETDRDTPERVSIVVERFSLAALAGVTLAVLTGTALLAWHVPAATSLVETSYGRALSGKIGLLLVAFALGGFARLVVLRRLRRGSSAAVETLRRSVRLELAVLLAVVLAAGAVTSAAPAAVVAGGGDVVGSLDGTADDLEVTIEAVPGSETVGGALVVREAEPTVVDVHVRRDGEPVDGIDDASLYLYHPQDDVSHTVELEEVGDGTYGTLHTFGTIGRWEIRVDLRTDEGYRSVWYESYVVIGEHAAHEHGKYGEATSFGELVRLGGLVAGIYGILALVHEAHALARRLESGSRSNSRD